MFSLNNDQLYYSYPNIWALSWTSGELELNMADNDDYVNSLNLKVPIVYGVKVAFATVYTLNERIFYINGSEVGRRSVKLEGDAIFKYLYLGNWSYREVESGDNTFNTLNNFGRSSINLDFCFFIYIFAKNNLNGKRFFKDYTSFRNVFRRE